MLIVVIVKSVALVAVLPAKVTVIFPEVAPDGTVVVIELAVLAETAALVPLNITEFSDGIVLKFVPVMVTAVPIGPPDGEKLVIVGKTVVWIVKSFALVAVLPATVTEIFPVVVPEGTVVVIVVVVLAVTIAVVPLNITKLFDGVALKLVPVITTVVPMEPVAGVKLVIVGKAAGKIVKSVALVAVFPPTVTLIVPVVAPIGTVVVIDVGELAETTAVVPLN